SVRQVQRQLQAELGAGPLAIARAQRAQTARLLIEATTLSMADVAFAAGFASVRAFNDTVREVFALSPTELRLRVPKGKSGPASGANHDGTATGNPMTLSVRLPFRTPLCPDNLFGHLVATGIPGVEEWRHGAYRRTVRLAHGPAVIALRPAPDRIDCHLALSDLRDLSPAISRCRWLLDLDADPVAVDELLSVDPALAPLVAKNPGRRVPRSVDSAEFAIRAVLGQQVSTAAARTHAGRLVAEHGERITDAGGGLTHLFPEPAAIAALNPETLAMPKARRRTLLGLATALAADELDLGAGSDWQHAREQLSTLPGVGPWTVETIAMRALGDPDAFAPTDLGIRAAAGGLGLPGGAGLIAHAEAWRPWRAYATQYLWAAGDHAINRLPLTD
ncbi:MAG: DNA-3-methyladenine glycosylase 2, partial [Mycobacteriales bacterium]